MKLLLALAVWGWAGGAKQASAPAQLKLDFGVSAKPLPAPPHMPASVVAALRAGDARAFARAAQAAEYEAPAGDEIQQGLLREAAERQQADAAMPQLLAAAEAARAEGKKGRKTKIDYDEFARLTALTPRLSLNTFQDVEPKRRILSASGYDKLIGPGGRRIPIAIADDSRVGHAFKNTYETLQRRRAKAGR